MTTTSRTPRAATALAVALAVLSGLLAVPVSAQDATGRVACPELVYESAVGGWSFSLGLPDRAALSWPTGALAFESIHRWSPDGARVVTGLQSGNQIDDAAPPPSVADWDGTDAVGLAVPAGGRWDSALRPVWSPDGQRFAIDYGRVTAVYSLSGALIAEIDDPSATDFPRAFSPDGSRLAMRRRAGGQDDLVLVDLSTSPPAVVVRAGLLVHDEPVPWSPDSTWVAATTDQGDGPRLVAVRADGSESRPLGDGAMASPVGWRPGTNEIAWAPASAGGSVRIDDVEGGTARSVDLAAGPVDDAVWSPGGASLVAAAGDRLWNVPALDDGGAAIAIGVPLLPDEPSRQRWRIAPQVRGSVVGFAYSTTPAGTAAEVVRGGLADLSGAAALPEPTTISSGDEWVTDLDVSPRRTSLIVDLQRPGYFGSEPLWRVLRAEATTWAITQHDVAVAAFPCGSGDLPATASTPVVPGWPTPPAPRSVIPSVDDEHLSVRVIGDTTVLPEHVTAFDVERSDTGEVLRVDAGESVRARFLRPEVPTTITFRARAVGEGGTSAWVAATPFDVPPWPITSGTVTGSDGPVAGAVVTLSGYGGGQARTTTTDSDGAWSFGAAAITADDELRVDPPTDEHVAQKLLGLDLLGHPGRTIDVALSPRDPGPGDEPVLESAPAEAVPIRSTTDDGPAAAVRTQGDVTVLDRLGRVRARIMDRRLTSGICATASSLFVHDLNRMAVAELGGDEIGQRTTSVALERAPLSCVDGMAWAAYEVVRILPGDISVRDTFLTGYDAEAASVDQLPLGPDQAATAGPGPRELYLWGDPTQIVDTASDVVRPAPGAFTSVDQVVVADGRAWGSNGWSVDLGTGDAVRFADVDGDDIAVDPAMGVVVAADQVLAIDTGLVLEDLGGGSASTFLDDGARLLTATADGTVKIRPTPFTDVPFSHPFAEAIGKARLDGLVTGADNRFRPADAVSRQAAVAMLWRAAGSPAGPFPDSGFSDVGADSPFATPIAWATAEGITNGRPDGTFGPTAAVTRGSWVAFQHRAAGSPAGPFDDPGFTDVPPTHPFALPIAWATDAGLLTGYPDGTFRPGAGLTRQVAAALLTR